MEDDGLKAGAPRAGRRARANLAPSEQLVDGAPDERPAGQELEQQISIAQSPKPGFEAGSGALDVGGDGGDTGPATAPVESPIVPPVKRMGFTSESAAAPPPLDPLAETDKKFVGVSRRKQEQQVQEKEEAAKAKSKYDEKATTAEIMDIPELEEEGKEDLTRVVAQAPKVRANKIQAMQELDEDQQYRLPATQDQDIDLSILTGVLCSSEMVYEPDDVWDPELLLSQVAAEFNAEKDKGLEDKMGDPLFSVRNNFFIGNWNACVNESANLQHLGDKEAIERDVFVYRSYIAMGSYELVLSEISESSATALQAVKLLAKYKSGRQSKDSVLSTLSEWLADAACNRNSTVLLVAGTIYMHEGNYVDALKACHGDANLELQALCVQALLKLDRVDKAEQAVKAMVEIDDDATITQLATAWVGLALGGRKVQEASYIFQELGDKYTWTPLLYNGRAVCHMKVGDWEDAERDLLEASAKDAKDPDTLANLITAGLHLAKNVTRYSSQLKIVAPTHPVVARLDKAEELFSQAAASMA